MIDDVLSVSKCGKESTEVNTIVQNGVNTKHLKLGVSKCFGMHVGKVTDDACSLVKVHDQPINEALSQKYLGQIISTDTKNDLDFDARYNRGIGGANQIISILQEASFSRSYFSTAMLFRTSIMMNSMLCSAEACYGITNQNLAKIASCDVYLMKLLF